MDMVAPSRSWPVAASSSLVGPSSPQAAPDRLRLAGLRAAAEYAPTRLGAITASWRWLRVRVRLTRARGQRAQLKYDQSWGFGLTRCPSLAAAALRNKRWQHG